MRKIWKFPIALGPVELNLPEDAHMLTVQAQGEQVCLWALCDPTKDLKVRQLVTYGTGHSINIDDGLKYLNTFQLHEGALVFHAFEITEP